MAYIQPRINKNGVITSYTIKVYRGTDMYGKQLKPYITSFKPNPEWTEHKREKELNKFVVEFESKCKKGLVVNEKQTFEQYANYVIGLKARTGAKRRTIERYKELLLRIIPVIGYLKLDEIRPQHLNNLYEILAQKGQNKVTGGKLSNKTIIEHHRLISTILNQAEKEMFVIYNAASKSTPPKMVRKEANYYELEDVLNIMKYLKNEPLKWQVALQLLIFSGCRRGEIMGLKWSKIDFKNKTIRIDNNLLYSKKDGIYEDTPKTDKSIRTVDLTTQTIELLKIYKREQNQKRLAMGTAWTQSDFVLTQENGKPMHPDSLTDYCSKFENKYNEIIDKQNLDLPKGKKIKRLPHINPHAFRHTQVSLLSAEGVEINVISRRLGHSKTSTTMDIYNHLLQIQENKASCVLEEMLLNKKAL